MLRYIKKFWDGYDYLFFSLKTLSYNLPEKVSFKELAEICIDLEDCTIEECVNIAFEKIYKKLSRTF